MPALTADEQRQIADAIADGRLRRIEQGEATGKPAWRKFKFGGQGPEFYNLRARHVAKYGLDIMTSPLAAIADALNAGNFKTARGKAYDVNGALTVRDHFRKRGNACKQQR